MLVVSNGRIHFGHIGVDASPFVHTTRTNEYIVVVL